MQQHEIYILIAVALVALFCLTLFWHHGKFRKLAKRYPHQAPGADAETRSKQTLTIGSANMGNKLLLARDERFLHISPSGFFKLVGAPSCSLPIAKIKHIQHDDEWAEVQVGIHRIYGPRWFLHPEEE